MRIWFQLLASETGMSNSIAATKAIADKAASPGTIVEVHGTTNGALGDNYRLFWHYDTREVIEALKVRFPKIVGPDVKDICYATQNRQAAVRELAKEVNVILVVGAKNSSNSNRLREIGEEMGVPSYLIDDARALDPKWLTDAKSIGVTAGASAPEELVQELIARLRDFGDLELELLDGIKENVYFKLPEQLREVAAS